MMSKVMIPVRTAASLTSRRAINQCVFQSALTQSLRKGQSFRQPNIQQSLTSFRCFHLPASRSSQPNNESVKAPVSQTAEQPITPDQSVTPSTETAAVKPAKKVGKLRLLWRQYGMVAVGSYAFFYFGTMGMLFVVLHNKLVAGLDPAALIEWLGAAQYFDGESSQMKQDAIVAWLATECTEPVRLALTALSTPPLARLFGRVPSKADAEAAEAAVAQVAAEQAPAATENKSNTPQ